MALVVLICSVPSMAATRETPLGSTDFRASPEQPVGWRGDGSGHFPGANPPLNWRLVNGAGSNIVWQTLIPFDSPSSVIVAGGKLFVTGNPYYLFCVDKLAGKIIWARTVSPYDAATREDRAGNKEVFEKLDKLAILRDELLGKIPAPGTNAIGKLAGELQKYSEEINKLLIGTDNVKYKNTGMGWSDGGYMASTPASDGKLIYVFNAWGVTACFDLDGNRKWIRFDQLTPREHGHYSSPLLAGELVIINIGTQYLALDKKTGAEVWKADCMPFLKSLPWSKTSPVGAVIGGEKMMVIGGGGLIRVADGKQLIGGCYYDGTASPIVDGGFVFGLQQPAKTVRYYKLPEKIDALFKPVVKGGTLKFDDAYIFVSSPLYHDGLLYIMVEKPVLYVVDVAAEKLVYRKDLDFGEDQKRGDRPYGCGISASPALAGGKLFITGNFGTTLVMEPGREYREVSRNTIDRRFDYNYRTNVLEGTVSNPFFDGDKIFYRAQKYLYCIGEPGE